MALVVSQHLSGGPKGSRSEALGERLARLVAGYGAMHDGGSVASRADAQLRARHHEHLVLLTPELVAAGLNVTADVITTPRGFWARIKQPNPSSTHHAFSSAQLDAELRSFLPKVPLVLSSTVKATMPIDQAPALGCGDLDGDDSLEIVAAGRHHIVVGRLLDGRLTNERTVAWGELSAIAPVPLRQPLSSVTLAEGQHLDVGSTDRANWVRLSPTLEPLASLPGMLPWSDAGCARRSGVGLLPEPRPCSSDAKPGLASEVHLIDAVAGARISTPEGGHVRYWAARRLGEDSLNVSSDAGDHTSIKGSGAQAALGDLDGDGSIEIAVSSSTLDPKKDQLNVYSWAPPSPPTPAFELAVPSGIDALTVCPAEDSGLAPLVLATGDQVWVLR